ncbi:PAS domain-containing sensor histidine kinase [bacterium]|nr:MAG: PAS domain-containing sensor histidine kinase [bacterium]
MIRHQSVWPWLVLAILTIIGVCSYTFLGFISDWPLNWWQLFLIIALAQVCNLAFVIAAWQQRQSLTMLQRLLIVSWAALSIWFWTFGLMYQESTVVTNDSQRLLSVFNFFWEVSAFGIFYLSYVSYRFKPVAQFIKTGTTQNPQKLMNYIQNLPRQQSIMVYALVILGYSIGSLSLYYVGSAPASEAWKHFGNGLMMSPLLALFFEAVHNNILGPVRQQLSLKYNIQPRQRRFSSQLVRAVTLIILSSMCMLILLYAQSFQLILRDHVTQLATEQVNAAINDPANPNGIPTAARVNQINLGANGFSWVQSVHDPLPTSDFTRNIQAQYISQRQATILDLNVTPRLIAFQSKDSIKVGTVVYLSDFYYVIKSKMFPIFVITIIVALLNVVAAIIFMKLFSQSLSRLIRAVEYAKHHGKFVKPDISTGDEFEELSETFATYMSQLSDRTRELRHSHARLEASVEALSHGFVMTDPNGLIITRNAAVARVLGLAAATVPDLAELASCISRSEAAKFMDGIAKIQNGKQTQTKLQITTNKNKDLSIFITSIRSDNHILGLVILIQDITEEAVAKRSRDEFFSIASHELRTPLTAIRGNTSMLQHYYHDQLKDPGVSSMINDIHESSVRLINIVNDFLDMSRIEQKRIQWHFSDFKLCDAVRETLADLSSTAREKHLKLSISCNGKTDAPIIVRADRDRTKQVLYNLVGNALKFTDKGSVSVQLTLSHHACEVIVADTGQGIALEDQKYLFRKFQQANHSLITRDTASGTGLGLYISKMLIESMKGRLWLEHSSSTDGTRFGFTLPRAHD